MTQSASPPASPPDVPSAPPCGACNGVGTIVMSLCCGRGCATCPGDGFMQAVDCYRCHGAGVIAGTAASIP